VGYLVGGLSVGGYQVRLSPIEHAVVRYVGHPQATLVIHPETSGVIHLAGHRVVGDRGGEAGLTQDQLGRAVGSRERVERVSEESVVASVGYPELAVVSIDNYTSGSTQRCAREAAGAGSERRLTDNLIGSLSVRPDLGCSTRDKGKKEVEGYEPHIDDICFEGRRKSLVVLNEGIANKSVLA